jgi:hypothetical protein
MLRAGEDFEIVTKEVAGCWVVPGAVNRDADRGHVGETGLAALLLCDSRAMIAEMGNGSRDEA